MYHKGSISNWTTSTRHSVYYECPQNSERLSDCGSFIDTSPRSQSGDMDIQCKRGSHIHTYFVHTGYIILCDILVSVVALSDISNGNVHLNKCCIFHNVEQCVICMFDIQLKSFAPTISSVVMHDVYCIYNKSECVRCVAHTNLR